ncbi:hypothetical protein BDQ12DRAFT_727118 [Crucibulum laeve]|uniref:Uncharacterized protein n=1 Tax=Crucibulum laeve TaxID=68775 RepID=A0A5C3LM25_9AGAR|nr:hypothetical protein BDQ12DRAFT_727118 [Crucibulum laeve]
MVYPASTQLRCTRPLPPPPLATMVYAASSTPASRDYGVRSLFHSRLSRLWCMQPLPLPPLATTVYTTSSTPASRKYGVHGLFHPRLSQLWCTRPLPPPSLANTVYTASFIPASRNYGIHGLFHPCLSQLWPLPPLPLVTTMYAASSTPTSHDYGVHDLFHPRLLQIWCTRPLPSLPLATTVYPASSTPASHDYGVHDLFHPCLSQLQYTRPLPPPSLATMVYAASSTPASLNYGVHSLFHPHLSRPRCTQPLLPLPLATTVYTVSSTPASLNYGVHSLFHPHLSQLRCTQPLLPLPLATTVYMASSTLASLNYGVRSLFHPHLSRLWCTQPLLPLPLTTMVYTASSTPASHKYSVHNLFHPLPLATMVYMTSSTPTSLNYSPAFTSRKRAISSVDTSPKKQAKKAKPALNVELAEVLMGEKGGKSLGAKGKPKRKAIKKTSAMKDAEVAAAEAKGDPDHLTHVEQVLTDSGASVAPPVRLRQSQEPISSKAIPAAALGSHCLCRSEIVISTEIQNKEKDKLDEKIEEEDEDDQGSEENDDNSTEEEKDAVVTTPIRSGSVFSEKSTDEYGTLKDTQDADIVMKTPLKKIQVQDVKMTSPDQKEVLQGASRTKGGILCGKAMGNVANMADFADTQDIKDVDQILASEFGKIKLYISAQDPQTLDISGMKPIAAEVPLSATIKPVLELLGIRYQPIKVPNQCLYVLDDKELWIVKGDYDNALKENTCIDWKKTKNKFSLTLLVSTFNHTLNLGSSSLAPNNPPLKNKDRPKISNEHFLELLDLNIDPALVNRKPSDRERNVHIAYQKYKAIIIAIKGYANAKVKPGGWPSQFQNLTETEIIHMFVSKTSWHNSYKFYHKATGFAVMYDWLQDNDSALGDIAVWGYEKAVYMFQDYELWIAGAEGDKEKEDAIVAAKKKEEIAASSGTTSAAVAKIHKKRKQTK